MTFTENDKLKALAIVHVFETSRAFGDYAACVVLNDGAGVSYGINQFTHRSGSLGAVVEKYLGAGGQIGRDIFISALPILRKNSVPAINRLAADAQFKRALRLAAVTREMKHSQESVAFARYLRPALQICESRGFVLPLSLAVVYDSVTHGSWERIAGRVGGGASRSLFGSPERPSLSARQAAEPEDTGRLSEKAWITEYVRKRHAWLTSVGRLRMTNYRTKFFLDQIATGNWQMRLPINVHGLRLTDAMFSAPAENQFSNVPPAPVTPANGQIPSDASSNAGEVATASVSQIGNADRDIPSSSGEANVVSDGPNILESASDALSAAASKFDRVDGVVSAVATRKDAAKSLWTTIIGTIWQAAWAVFGFFIGLPRIVWIVVAIVAAVLAIIFLYRQVVLGKIRETVSEPPA